MIPPQIQLSSQHLGEKDILLESEDRVEKIFLCYQNVKIIRTYRRTQGT